MNSQAPCTWMHEMFAALDADGVPGLISESLVYVDASAVFGAAPA